MFDNNTHTNDNWTQPFYITIKGLRDDVRDGDSGSYIYFSLDSSTTTINEDNHTLYFTDSSIIHVYDNSGSMISDNISNTKVNFEIKDNDTSKILVYSNDNSTLLDNKEEELSDIAYNITRKSSSINVWGDDDWATPQEEEKKNE